MAQKTQNLGLEVFDFATDTTSSFVNGLAGLENSNMHKIDNAITNKVKIDEEVVQKINFIPNGIIKDGLVSDYFINTSTPIPNSKVLHIFTKTKITKGVSASTVLWFPSGNSKGITTTGVSADKFSLKYKVFNTTIKSLMGDSDVFYIYECIFNIETNMSIFILRNLDGEILFKDIEKQFKDSVDIISTITAISDSNVVTEWVQAYNRILTPKEIQHNFSVLNNTPSINKINDYTISTDTHHIETPTGVTEEERYSELLKTTCKEFSSNGEAIVVNNGIPKQKVLSGKIEGQTVKNPYAFEYSSSGVGGGTLTKYGYKIPNGMMYKANNSQIDLVGQAFPTIKGSSDYILPNTKYTLIFRILKNEFINYKGITICGNKDPFFNASTNRVFHNAEFNLSPGLKKIVFTTPSNITAFNGFGFGFPYIIGSSGQADGAEFGICNVALLEGDIDIDANYFIPFGLNSTKAVINNNGEKYSFYEPTINGVTKVMKATKGTQKWVEINAEESRDTTKYDYKLVSNNDLGHIGTVYDYIDMARKVKVVNTKEIVLNGSENWVYYGVYGSNPLFYTDELPIGYVTSVGSTSSGSGISDKLVWQKSHTEEYNVINSCRFKYNDGKRFYVCANDASLESFKKHLLSNPITVRYQLATPIEVPMTNEEIKAYDVYRKVIDLGGLEGARDTFEVKEDGSAVYTQNTLQKIFDGNSNETWSNALTLDNMQKYFSISVSDAMNFSSSLLSNKAIGVVMNASYNDANTLAVYIDANSKLRFTGSPIQQMSVSSDIKMWLQTNPLVVRYQLATPIVTHIPKELVPTILTQTTNEFQFGDDVMATKSTISVPVDKISEMEKQIATLALNMSTLTCDFITHANEL